KPRAAPEAAEVIEVLARAMGFAHQQHIIHRDLKPSNVLLQNPTPQPPPRSGEGEEDSGSPSPLRGGGWGGGVRLVPKITDFGLAKAVEEGSAGQTASGAILGTPAYMAPEQARGDHTAIGPHSDLYALGAILYEMLTGRPPFQGATLLETLELVQN